MSQITLTETQRSTLLSLQQTTSLYDRTQVRLNTGKKINTASDDPVAYFRSQSLFDRSNNLTTIKSNIDQNIQALNTAQTGTSQVESLLQEMQAVVEGARSGSLPERTSATQQFNTLANQLAQLVLDTSYQGLNLLTSTNASLITQFSDRTAAVFNVSGYNLVDPQGGNAQSLFTQANAVFTVKGISIFDEIVGNNAGAGGSPTTSITGFSQLDLTASSTAAIPGSQVEAIFTATSTRLNNAISQIQAITASLGTYVGILTTRSNFSSNYINDLTTGGDGLTLADYNTEAANSQALNLRQQLGIQSLSTSGQMNQSVLQLLK